MQKKQWDGFAGIYDLVMRRDKSAYDEVARLARKTVSGRKTLELACGTGLLSFRVADAAKSYLATDYSEKMIEAAQKRPAGANLRFEVQDAFSLPYADGRFDAVLIANALHIMPTPERALSEIFRVLNPGGVLIAPTFLHERMNAPRRFFAWLMKVTAGFRTENAWTMETLTAFLEENGFRCVRRDVIRASFPIAYVECVKKKDGVLRQETDAQRAGCIAGSVKGE